MGLFCQFLLISESSGGSREPIPEGVVSSPSSAQPGANCRGCRCDEMAAVLWLIPCMSGQRWSWYVSWSGERWSTLIKDQDNFLAMIKKIRLMTIGVTAWNFDSIINSRVFELRWWLFASSNAPTKVTELFNCIKVSRCNFEPQKLPIGFKTSLTYIEMASNLQFFPHMHTEVTHNGHRAPLEQLKVSEFRPQNPCFKFASILHNTREFG